MKRIIRWLRWWRWFLGGPLPASLILGGVDKQSREIIYTRHDEKEPAK